MHFKYKYVIFLVVPLVLSLVLFSPILAQNGDIVLTIGLQEWQQDVLSDELIAEFQAENPGINVVHKYYTSGPDSFYSMNVSDIDASFESAEEFVASADILTVQSTQISVEMTRAGYLLDLTPLLNSDLDAGLDDFYPAALQSFQWDGSTWALPVSVQANMVIYDKTAFDAAGLAYPDETWTLQDFVNAGRTLTVRDNSGTVTVPGFYGFDDRVLYRALLGHGLYDPMAFPEAPKLDDPDLVTLIEEWDAYNEEIFPEGNMGNNIDWNAIPMTIQGTWRLDSQFGNPEDTHEWGASLLPGGGAYVVADGFAISAGTQYPEAAYKLIQFLTKSPLAVNRFFGDSPARRSLVGVDSGDEFIFRAEREPEVQALIDEALENGIPASELRFMDYLFIARSDESATDTLQALQTAQEKALENLEKAENRRGTTVLAVPTPVPTPVLNSDEISIKFMYSSNIFPIPNREQWEDLIQRFVAEDPEIGQIQFETNATSTEEYNSMDCYYTGQNPVPYADLSTMLSLDPLIASDPDFDESDILGNAMTLVQREGGTWALPIHVQPAVFWYNTTLFEEAGAFEPYIGWTANDFETALRTLKEAKPDAEPFVVSSFGNSYLLALIAAYGGMPVDYTTDPTTFNLTDPANVEAIRQVLTLAKDGLIAYQALDGNFGGGGGNEAALYDGYLSTMDWRMSQLSQDENPYKIALFPRGSDYQPLAYSLGTGTISSNTQYPEACYRWLRAIAATPELYTSMPVSRSMIENPALEASLGEDAIAMFRELTTVFDEPDMISLPGQFGGGGSYGSFIMDTWMNRAFDNIVLEDADVESELEAAQMIIDDYTTCTASFPTMEDMRGSTPEEAEAVFRDYVDCGVTLDPSLAERYSFILEADD